LTPLHGLASRWFHGASRTTFCKHFARRTRVLYIQHDPTTSCSLNRPPQYTFLPKTYFLVYHRACHGSYCGLAVPFLRVTEDPHAQCYPLRRHHVMTCLGFCFIYGTWTLFTKKGRRLDAEIKRTQNASFPAMATSVKCIMRRLQSERMRSYSSTFTAYLGVTGTDH